MDRALLADQVRAQPAVLGAVAGIDPAILPARCCRTRAAAGVLALDAGRCDAVRRLGNPGSRAARRRNAGRHGRSAGRLRPRQIPLGQWRRLLRPHAGGAAGSAIPDRRRLRIGRTGNDPSPAARRSHGHDPDGEIVMDAAFAETLVANMPDALIYSDSEGTIRYWNNGAERMFGHAAADAVGQSLDLIIPDGLRARHWTGYRETMRTGQTRYGDGQTLSVPAVRKDGKRISVAFTIVPF